MDAIFCMDILGVTEFLTSAKIEREFLPQTLRYLITVLTELSTLLLDIKPTIRMKILNSNLNCL